MDRWVEASRERFAPWPAERMAASIDYLGLAMRKLSAIDNPFTSELFMRLLFGSFCVMSETQRKLFLRRFVSDGLSESTLRAIYQTLYRPRQRRRGSQADHAAWLWRCGNTADIVLLAGCFVLLNT